MHVSTLDWSIVIVYFAVVAAVGFYFTQRAGRDESEFFVSGRNLPWWLAGVSMVATTFATDTPNLVAGLVREHGVAGNWAWWAFLLTGMVTVFFYAKLWRRSGVLTDISFYELRYDGKPAAFLRGFRSIYLGLVFNVIIMANVTLAAVKISNLLLGLSPYVTVTICCVVTALYSGASGLWGVVATDFLLFIVSMTGAIGAAYYALQLPQVNGLSGLLSHDAVRGAMHIFPDFNNWDEVVPLLIIPFAVQWWSVWYPGAEPGGGGYVAQRMLAAKNERHAFLSTFFFNLAHYAVRPWPWIIVALASIVVFPNAADIKAAFPYADPSLVQEDMAYPAMLTFLPSGMLGLVVASLAAAYMSTISTHLNWGASYLVEDFYKRFVRSDAPAGHYVSVGRVITGVLMVLACLMSFALESALQSFNILLQIGAGTGLIYLLRWFWWRVNAWSEITGMVVSFVIAIDFQIFFPLMGWTQPPDWQQMVIGVAVTTASWLFVTMITRPAKKETLQNFYNLIRPYAWGWRGAVDVSQAEGEGGFTASLACVVLGCLGIYSALFCVGYLIYGNTGLAAGLALVCAVSMVGVFKILPRIQFLD
ncbi:MAG: Na+:solute symporter [bacterium]|nr:Na+:solute symporter [bacterium]